jgi:hypothetical protein
MTFKFTTLLKSFELGQTLINDAIWMEWYCYNPNAENGILLQGVSFKQVPQLEAYMKSTANFGGVVTYRQAYDDEMPVIDPSHLVDDSERGFPEFLIISPSKATEVDIVLCKEDGSVQHDYNLEFSIIGKVLGLNE